MTNIIIIDTKTYTGDEFEAGVNKARYICPTKTGEYLGFTEQSKFLVWAEKQGFGPQAYAAQQTEAHAKALASELKDPEMRLLPIYEKRAEFYRLEIKRAFRDMKIDPTNIPLPSGLNKSISRFLYINLVGSIFYDKPNYQGKWLYLWPGYHPKLSWYGKFWNDQIESVRVWSDHVYLYQHTWFRGWCLPLYEDWNNLVWFSNRVSSVIVG
jgi:hypothetical protein